MFANENSSENEKRPPACSNTERELISAYNQIFIKYLEQYPQFENDLEARITLQYFLFQQFFNILTFQKLNQCITNSNIHYPMYFVDEDDTDDNHVEFKKNFTKICNKRELLFGCFNEMSTSIEKYFAKNDTDLMNRLDNISKNIFDYGCRDNGTTVLRLRQPNNNQCIYATNDDIGKCMEKVMSTFEEQPFEEIREYVRLNGCADYKTTAKEIRQCIVGGLAKCSEFMSNLFDDIIDMVYDEFSCNSE